MLTSRYKCTLLLISQLRLRFDPSGSGAFQESLQTLAKLASNTFVTADYSFCSSIDLQGVLSRVYCHIRESQCTSTVLPLTETRFIVTLGLTTIAHLPC